MDYLKEYKSFIYSHYLSEGVRMTVGIVLPALVFNYFNLLQIGVVVSLGAMSVSITDNAGPIHHRKNGMLACIAINTIIALVTGFLVSSPFALGVLILLACFTLSMIGVFGARANAIGVSGLLIMVLTFERNQTNWEVVMHALFIFGGALWYMLLSLALYSFRPYKLAQQALGDCILATASYMRIRASFYKPTVDYDKTYQLMFEQQVLVHEKQKLVRELLFKSRYITKESNKTGRTLLMIFTDTVDLFERTMSSHNDYKTLHKAFKDDDILERFRQLILQMSDELDKAGFAIESGFSAVITNDLSEAISETTAYFNTCRDEKRSAQNLDEFISMRHILNSMEDIANRIQTLQSYTTDDAVITQKKVMALDYDQFVTHQPIDVKLLQANLTFKSNNLRHAVRISVATLMGYLVSLFLPVGHSYWILLTIIVILKPTYSLTKKRNYERLAGTIIGALIGLLILYFIQDKNILFIIMIALMIGTYSLLRTNYMISVIFMTPYILLLFQLISNTSYVAIITDRITDTAIGSGIAFLANLILLPAWEQGQIHQYMLEAIESNKHYFKEVATAFTGKPLINTQYKLSRKNAYVALANLSDAFTRMLAEPKSKQKNSKILHQFVVLNHTLTSHIATLSYYVKPLSSKFASKDFNPLIENAVAKLEDASKLISKVPADKTAPEKLLQNNIQNHMQQLLNTRKAELQQGIMDSETKIKLGEFKPIADQFNFIDNLSTDIRRTSSEWANE